MTAPMVMFEIALMGMMYPSRRWNAAILAASVLAGLVCFAAIRGQQWADAADKYRDAAAIAGPYTGEAIVGEARAREHAGDVEKARALYRQAYEQFPDLPGRELLATKISPS